MSTEEFTQGPRKTRIWPYALLATLIAVVWATIAASSGSVAPGEIPDGTPAGITDALAYMAGYAIGSTVLAAGLTFLVFYFIVFRRRGASGKSIAVFAIMAVVTFPFAMAGRFIVVAEHKAAMTASIAAWENRTRERSDQLRRDLAVQMTALKLDEYSLMTVERPEDVEEGLARLRQSAVLESRYVRDLEALFQTAHAELDALGLPEDAKQRLGRMLDTDFVEPSRHATDLDVRIGQKGIEVFTFLQSTKASWTIQNHRFVFTDRAAMARFNTLQYEMRGLASQLPHGQ